jgi:hypothetical protein
VAYPDVIDVRDQQARIRRIAERGGETGHRESPARGRRTS